MYGLIGIAMFMAYLSTLDTTFAIIASIFAIADSINYVGRAMNKFTEAHSNKN